MNAASNEVSGIKTLVFFEEFFCLKIDSFIFTAFVCFLVKYFGNGIFPCFSSYLGEENAWR